MVQEATTSVNALNRLVQSQFAELGWRQFAGVMNSARMGDSRLPAHLEKSLYAFRNDETLGFYRALSTAVRGKTPFLAASKFLTREFPLANRCSLPARSLLHSRREGCSYLFDGAKHQPALTLLRASATILGIASPFRRGRQVVRLRSAKPSSAVRFRPAPPIFLR